jgi:hypothetical protein
MTIHAISSATVTGRPTQRVTPPSKIIAPLKAMNAMYPSRLAASHGER